MSSAAFASSGWSSSARSGVLQSASGAAGALPPSSDIVAQRIQQDSAEAAAAKSDRASFPPTDPGPLSRLPRDTVQSCLQFLCLGDLAMTHYVSPVWRAAHDAERTKRWIFAQQVPRMIKRLAGELQSEDERSVLPAVRELRTLVSAERSPPIKQVLATKGLLERLIVLVQRDNPELQFETAWAASAQRTAVTAEPTHRTLTNLTSGTTVQCAKVIAAGALPIFTRMVADTRPEYRDAQEQAVWALGNIAGDGCEARDAVLRAGPLPALLALLSSDASRPSLLRNATWTVSNCVRGKPPPRWTEVQATLPVLSGIIAKGLDVEVLTDACWALSYLSDDSTATNAHISAVIATGVVPHLVQLLKHPNPRILTPALRTLGNIVTGDDLQTSAVLNAGMLPVLLSLLSHSRKGVRKEAVWTLSNITAGNSHQIQACIDAGLLSVVIDLLIASADEEVNNECSYALANSLTGGTVRQVCSLVSQSALRALNTVLKCDKEPVLRVALEALERVMRAGDELRDNGLDESDAPLALSSRMRDLVSSGFNPFTDAVAVACMQQLVAVNASSTLDAEVVGAASGIIESWWDDDALDEALQMQAQAIAAETKEGAGAAAAAAAAAASAPAAMSEEERLAEAMEQTRITEQKAKDEAALALAGLAQRARMPDQ